MGSAEDEGSSTEGITAGIWSNVVGSGDNVVDNVVGNVVVEGFFVGREVVVGDGEVVVLVS